MLVPVDKEQLVVAEIGQLRADGKTLREINDDLNN
jgi:hypothetical protein